VRVVRNPRCLTLVQRSLVRISPLPTGRFTGNVAVGLLLLGFQLLIGFRLLLLEKSLGFCPYPRLLTVGELEQRWQEVR